MIKSINYMFDQIIKIAYKKYGIYLGGLKLKWHLIDNNSHPISFNNKTGILIVKCRDTESVLEKRYQDTVIKEKVLINCHIEVKKIKFV